MGPVVKTPLPLHSWNFVVAVVFFFKNTSRTIPQHCLCSPERGQGSRFLHCGKGNLSVGKSLPTLKQGLTTQEDRRVQQLQHK